MSSVIDSRIVEMKFDNKQFESAVSTSMSTLAKLKESLNFDKNGTNFLSNLSASLSKIDLSGISSVVEGAGEKFSVLEQVAVGALRRIGEQAVSVGEKLVKSLSVDQISAGWQKYEEKTTAVQTIMAATASQFSDTGTQMEYVNAQLDKLNWFTDETSYNFVDMVGNIGKFTSNGIALESAVTSMQGIANWAAISGQNAATASRAMYNLAQAIGVGSVKLIDWRSIENANMATQEFKQQVLEAAVAQGTLKKATDGTYKTIKGTAVSLQDFNSALSEGWFSKDVLTSVLDSYGSVTNKLYDLSEASGATATDILQLVEAQKSGKLSTEQLAKVMGDDALITIDKFRAGIEELASDESEFGIKAFKAAQEAKTFTDAIDATKDAVSTGWMKSFELMFGDYEHARVLWTDVANGLYDIFAAGSEARNELLKDWGNSKWENLTKDISKAGVSVTDFEDSVTYGLRKHGVAVDAMIEKYGSLQNAIEAGAVRSDTLMDTIRGSLEDFINDRSGGSLVSAEDKLTEIQDLVSKVWSGSLGNGVERKKAIEDLGYEYEVIQKLVEKGADYKLKLEDLTDVQLKVLGLSEEEVALLRSIQDDYDLTDLSGESGRQMFAESITNALTAVEHHLRLFKETWHDVFGSLDGDMLKNITAAFRDFTASFALYEENADGVEVLNQRGEDLVAVLQRIFEAGNNVAKLFKNVGRIIGQFASEMQPVVSAARALGLTLLDLFNSVMGRFNNFLGTLDFTKEFNSVSEVVTHGIEWITEKVDLLREKFEQSDFSGILEKIGNKFSSVRTKFQGFFQSSEEGWKSALSFENALDKVGNALKKVKEFFQPVLDKLQEFWNALKGKFDFNNITSVGDAIHRVFAGIGDIVGGAWHGLLDAVDRLDLSFGDLLKTFVGVKISGKMLTSLLGGSNKSSIKGSVTGLLDSLKKITDNFGEKGLIGTLLGDFSLGGNKSGFDKFADNIQKIGSSMLMAAGGVLAMGLALLIFNTAVQMDPQGMGMLAMATAMTTLVAVLLALSTAGPKVALAGAGILVAAVGIAALAGALLLFNLAAKQDPDGMGMLAMASAMATLTAVLLALSFAGLKVIPAAVGLLVAAAALIVLAGALALFNLVAKQDPEGMGMLAMAAALLTLTTVLLALSLAGPMVIVAAGAMLILSASLIVMAAALEAFVLIAKQGVDAVAGLVLLAGTLALVAGIVAVLSALGPEILLGAAALVLAGVAVVAIAAGLAVAAVAVAALGIAISVLIAGVGTAVGAAISAIGTGIGTALSAVGDGIGGIFEGIGTGIGAGIAAIGEGIATANSVIGFSVESLGASIGAGLENVALGVDGASSIIGAAFDRLGESVGGTIERFGAKVGSAIEGVSESIAKAGENIRGVGDSIASVGEGIASFGENVKTLGLLDLVSIGAGLIEFSKGVKKLNGNQVKFDSDNVVTYVAAVSKFSELIPLVSSVAAQLEAKMKQLGQSMGANLAAGLSASSGIARSAGSNVGASAYSGANGYVSSFYSIGYNMAQGLANGLSSNSSVVSSAAASVAKGAETAAKNTAEVKSPSRVFARIGEFMSLGMAKGIKDEGHAVDLAAQDVTDNAIDIASSVAKFLAASMANNDESFTITPVLDLSSIEKGTGQLSTMLSGANTSIGLSGQISSVLAQNQNGGVGPQMVTFDQATLDAMASGAMNSQTVVRVNFEGSLAQLASILQPAIATETNRLGTNLVME